MKGVLKILMLTFVFLPAYLHSQTDTIITADNTVLTGEIKSMEKGVLVMETSFSDKDFQIEWLKIKQLVSSREFSFVLFDGTRLHGPVSMDSSAFYTVIYDKIKGPFYVQPSKIVYLKHVKSGKLLDVISLALDVGYSYTRANHLNQLNGSIKGDYYSQFWGVTLLSNTVQSNQDNIDPTKRTNAELGFRLFMAKDYFASLNADFNNNSEQQLKLRSNYNLAFGKFFIHTNRIYFNASLGFAINREIYDNENDNRNSTESIFSIQFNLFDIGDLNLFTDASLYPSLTDNYRLRSSVNFSLKYDLPRDFYLKTSIDFKYDTKPIEGVAPEDYVFTAGVGWEL